MPGAGNGFMRVGGASAGAMSLIMAAVLALVSTGVRTGVQYGIDRTHRSNEAIARDIAMSYVMWQYGLSNHDRNPAQTSARDWLNQPQASWSAMEDDDDLVLKDIDTMTVQEVQDWSKLGNIDLTYHRVDMHPDWTVPPTRMTHKLSRLVRRFPLWNNMNKTAEALDAAEASTHAFFKPYVAALRRDFHGNIMIEADVRARESEVKEAAAYVRRTQNIRGRIEALLASVKASSASLSQTVRESSDSSQFDADKIYALDGLVQRLAEIKSHVVANDVRVDVVKQVVSAIERDFALVGAWTSTQTGELPVCVATMTKAAGEGGDTSVHARKFRENVVHVREWLNPSRESMHAGDYATMMAETEKKDYLPSGTTLAAGLAAGAGAVATVAYRVLPRPSIETVSAKGAVKLTSAAIAILQAYRNMYDPSLSDFVDVFSAPLGAFALTVVTLNAGIYGVGGKRLCDFASRCGSKSTAAAASSVGTVARYGAETPQAAASSVLYIVQSILVAATGGVQMRNARAFVFPISLDSCIYAFEWTKTDHSLQLAMLVIAGTTVIEVMSYGDRLREEFAGRFGGEKQRALPPSYSLSPVPSPAATGLVSRHAHRWENAAAHLKRRNADLEGQMLSELTASKKANGHAAKFYPGSTNQPRVDRLEHIALYKGMSAQEFARVETTAWPHVIAGRRFATWERLHSGMTGAAPPPSSASSSLTSPIQWTREALQVRLGRENADYVTGVIGAATASAVAAGALGSAAAQFISVPIPAGKRAAVAELFTKLKSMLSGGSSSARIDAGELAQVVYSIASTAYGDSIAPGGAIPLMVVGATTGLVASVVSKPVREAGASLLGYGGAPPPPPPPAAVNTGALTTGHVPRRAVAGVVGEPADPAMRLEHTKRTMARWESMFPGNYE